MPIFEYACAACGWRFERILARDKADTPQPCPECGSASERRLSAFAVSVAGAHGACTDQGGCHGPSTPTGGCCASTTGRCPHA